VQFFFWYKNFFSIISFFSNIRLTSYFLSSPASHTVASGVASAAGAASLVGPTAGM